ncbi:MAG: hypothetical protein WD737_12695 [Gemmatimonadota bacterium]
MLEIQGEMRSGTVNLASGRWHWTLRRQWTGTTLTFQHGERSHDEMRTWASEVELTEEQVVELGREPLERTWMDVDGLKWRLSLELPTGWQRAMVEQGEDARASSVWLVFRRGGLRRAADVSERARLGDFTHAELRHLLEQATALSLHS